ncbi:hypothetical protein M0R45_030520 [Rubus argutus]|uniref:Uncharacterized protein n=1 Tax=Rubus argutus TaxID=59490 RepID=A0AAW1WFF3_RUBAR
MLCIHRHRAPSRTPAPPSLEAVAWCSPPTCNQSHQSSLFPVPPPSAQPARDVSTAASLPPSSSSSPLLPSTSLVVPSRVVNHQKLSQVSPLPCSSDNLKAITVSPSPS